MKSFNEYITEASKAPKKGKVVAVGDGKPTPDMIAKVDAIKPLTICDLLKESTPKMLASAVTNYLWEDLVAKALKGTYKDGMVKGVKVDRFRKPKWLKDLQVYADALREWYEREGGSKKDIIPKIVQIASCKDRAKWAKWSGKAWRGFRRSMAQIKGSYEFTDKAPMMRIGISSAPNIIAKVKYQSRYGVQSWTDDMAVAGSFSDSGESSASATVSVIIETEITEDESFLSPKASEALTDAVHEEHEVLRISNKPKVVTAYIDVSSLVDSLADSRLVPDRVAYEIENEEIPKAKRVAMYIKAATPKVASLIGERNAKIVMNPKHPVCKLLLDYAVR
jgi:hypothetical protein